MDKIINPIELTYEEPEILQSALVYRINTAVWGIDRLARIAKRKLIKVVQVKEYDGVGVPITFYELTALGRASLAAAKAGLN